MSQPRSVTIRRVFAGVSWASFALAAINGGNEARAQSVDPSATGAAATMPVAAATESTPSVPPVAPPSSGTPSPVWSLSQGGDATGRPGPGLVGGFAALTVGSGGGRVEKLAHGA
jgi:hypothetical protein